METLEKSNMCRLCGKHLGVAIDIFDKTEDHMRKINAILPILVHEMDLLPKQMCSRCRYKLEEFYNFYVDCAKTDTEFKSQLSWMNKENVQEKIITPMVKINKFKIKAEPSDNDDIIDSCNVLEHIRKNSLMFPASILKHSFDSKADCMFPCVNCQCIYSSRIKINNKSSKQVKVGTNVKSKSNVCSSNIVSDNVSKFNKFERANKNFSFKNLIKNHDNICSKSNNIYNSNILKPEKLDRTLRPRKVLIDYMGPRKKKKVSNIKAKFKSKLDIFDPSLISPVNMNLSHDLINSMYPSPILKLEKVDETFRTLRTRKNLEEFNRRIKDLKWNQSWQKTENQTKKILFKGRNFSKKNLLQGVNKSDKNLPITKLDKKQIQIEEIANKKNLQVKKRAKKQKFLKYMPNNSNKNVKIMKLNIKQELVNKIPENKSIKQLRQEKSIQIDRYKSQKISKVTIDRYPLCAVVKLEKDYTCNVDYPRIQIKRHLSLSNPSESQNTVLEVLPGQTSIFELAVDRKSRNIDSNISSKNLRNKGNRLKLINKNKPKISKKKKNLNLVNVKTILLEKATSIISQPDFKRYCEECDLCFKNKELYKLHPCYQK
ncbi:PREDICTED: uncharacterized protein PFB0765w-like [Ceratosolen solmsi marchali]|uniref:Uncharacterized protein PFB0765w-like n=1 Tax=Ceratosolen solmsi marchali TaxID=326594 RepID=A0AAJ6YT64_9HYME|nr:PREDICTED: uncharacterized protein PFB0765w-like [Ceratosolen solmsi marchali]